MNYVLIQNIRINLDMISTYESAHEDRTTGHRGYYIRFFTPSADSFNIGFQNEQTRNEALNQLDRVTSPSKGN